MVYQSGLNINAYVCWQLDGWVHFSAWNPPMPVYCTDFICWAPSSFLTCFDPVAFEALLVDWEKIIHDNSSCASIRAKTKQCDDAGDTYISSPNIIFPMLVHSDAYPQVIKHGNEQSTIYRLCSHWSLHLVRAFHIAIFDYQRVSSSMYVTYVQDSIRGW